MLADAAERSEETHTGGYDVVFAFECMHDVPDPVGFLATMRGLATPGGYVIVADERTEPQFSPGDKGGPELEQLFYGWSLTVCLPDGMSHRPSAATGTVMRPSTLAKYAAAAGFSQVETLPVEHDMLRFYRLLQ